jgi:hypothetical protein
MIVYRVVNLFGLRKRCVVERRSDRNARRNYKRYRRIWFWHEDRWNQRHGIKTEQWQEWEI